MPNQSTKVVPIRQGIRASVEVREVVDLAYGLWLAHGFRDCTPEEALFTAFRHLSGNTAAGLFLVVPERNSVWNNIYPLYRVARK
jgi:hypothetical protein